MNENGKCFSIIIGCSFEIIMPNDYIITKKKKILNEIEQCIISYFSDNFKLEHGNEYFHTTKKKWEDIKPIFIEEMIFILTNVYELNYIFHETPETPLLVFSHAADTVQRIFPTSPHRSLRGSHACCRRRFHLVELRRR